MKVNFEVSAKAARLIGRENIADVDGALSELIKNAYDADAPCVYIEFDMPFPDVPTQTTFEALTAILSTDDLKRVLPFFEKQSEKLIRKESISAEDKKLLQTILFSYNKIIVADNGDGMTLDILQSAWMQIATSNKEKKAISKKGRVKTGAKGIGRFALDKLSRHSVMYTQTEGGSALRWEIDWDQFSNSKLLRDVQADIQEDCGSLSDLFQNCISADYREKLFTKYTWDSGTLFILTPTRDAWNERLFAKINTNLKSINPLGSVDQFDVIVNNQRMPELSYQTEEVSISDQDYDYQLTVQYDGRNTLQVKIIRNEFYDTKRSTEFSVGHHHQNFPMKAFWNRPAFQNSPYRKEDYTNGNHELTLDVDRFINAQDFDKVYAVGPFTADLYFVKNGKSDFPFVKDIPVRHRKEFLEKFSGIKLYRDNFKVRPYGDEGSEYDWLQLNDRANKSPASVSNISGAWRVLPYQMIGVVRIGRKENLALSDMANREGLAQNDSYFYFVQMLQEAISRFEFDRQYIYREFNLWRKECESSIASSAERIKDDVNREKNDYKQWKHTSYDEKRNNYQRFSEEEYRETVHVLLEEHNQDLKAKQTLEILSSSGVILNTFFHEFKGISTALYTRTSQLRSRIDYLLAGKPYTGLPFMDPYRKLEVFDHTDQMLAAWLEVVMNAIEKDSFSVKEVSLVAHCKQIVEIWDQLLREKNITINISVPEVENDEFLLKISDVDLYLILNNFMLNTVYFLEHAEQETREAKISFEKQANTLIMTMENNGPILDEKFQEQPMRIFEIGESSKKGGGTGLGLWLMRDAVMRNDGIIQVLTKTTGFGLKIIWNK